MTTQSIHKQILSATLLSLATLLVMSMLAPAASAATKTWTNTDTTWPPTTATQEWFYNDGDNWNLDTLPGADDTVRLTSATATTVYLNNTVTGIHSITMNNGARLYLGSDAQLSAFTYNGAQIAVGSTYGTPTRNDAELYIAAGAEVLLNSSISIRFGSTLETYGTLKPTAMALGEGTLKIAGGMVNPRNAADTANGALSLAAPAEKNGIVRQTGGAVTLSQLQIGKGNAGSSVYEISGGSLNGTDSNALMTSYGGAMSGTFTLHVIGSGASGISFNGLRYGATSDNALTTWAFTLDNSANHITPVVFTANGNSGAGLRTNSNLDVNLRGGVLLSGADTFTLIERVSGTDTLWGTGPGALWTDSTTGDKSAVTVSLAGTAKGTLDASTGGNSVSFAGTSTGYIDLTGLTGSETSLKLNLLWDADNSTADVANFTALLDDAGISNWLIDTDQIGIELNPSVSGASYFAWDLLGIGSDGALKGITTIPEPATGFLVILGGSLLLMRRRRR